MLYINFSQDGNPVTVVIIDNLVISYATPTYAVEKTKQ